jgi:hypothetical protein
MEVGFAAGVGVPIFSTNAPGDLTLREYVTVVPALSEALHRAEGRHRSTRREGILIDPHASVEDAHEILERIKDALTYGKAVVEATPSLYQHVAELDEKIALPTRVQ